MHHAVRFFAVAGTALLIASPSLAQTAPAACETPAFIPITDVGDVAAARARTLELIGAAPIALRTAARASSGRLALVCPGPWADQPRPRVIWALEPAPVNVRGGWSSGFADSRVRGALWNGRGAGLAVTGGFTFRSGILSFGVLPEMVYEQNSDFPTRVVEDSTRSVWAHPWRFGTIDLPQRFGDDAFSSITPGQSFVRLDWNGVAAGVSNENLWWGPAIRNALVMTNNAPGFAHAFVGTRDRIGVGPVQLAGELVWGQLVESDYFDDDASNDERLLSGIVLILSTPHIAGLEVGVTRVFVRYWPDEWAFRDAFPFIEPSLKNDLDADSTGSRNDRANQLISVFARWVFPTAGLEIYGEYGREDHAWDLDDLISEPDHTAGVTLGLQKVFGNAPAPNRLSAEITRLLLSPTFLRRSAGPFYAHGTVVQGYTHRGQILGASIGPGSESQYVAFDMLRPEWSAGLWLERVRRDDLWFYRNMPQRFSYAAHDVEMTAGLRLGRTLGQVELDASASYGSRRNRDFRFCNPDVLEERNCQLPQFRDGNAQMWLGATWRPPVR